MPTVFFPPNFVFSDRNGEFTLFSARSGEVPFASGPLWQATIASVRMLPLGGGGLRQWISILSTILRRSSPMCLWFSHMARFLCS
ncbi:hypothetical protein PVAP13_4KG346400 [Panicum virgatum]|uniref:Uncharacterized protein n=1 Tax=Panicum virgatum TaxID=38727 RepID=A0A8T0TWC2_PANVG|nr:hypothetical protein PVAP13_4KG346400 [Panicum virgatum]